MNNVRTSECPDVVFFAMSSIRFSRCGFREDISMYLQLDYNECDICFIAGWKSGQYIIAASGNSPLRWEEAMPHEFLLQVESFQL